MQPESAPVITQPNWPFILTAYRLSSGLTQESFADKVGVAPSTVSRWESGKQAPNLRTQALLRPNVLASQLRSKEEWAFRVNASFGHEMLVDGEDIVLAVSDTLVEFHQLRRDQIAGSSLGDFFRLAFSSEATSVQASVRDHARDLFFSGSLRLIEQISDVRTPTGVVRFASELWPVVASDGEILSLIIASMLGPSPEPEFCRSYRLVSSNVVKHDERSETEARATQR
jgi:transcriptional regulator with XRE-family HTH domain